MIVASTTAIASARPMTVSSTRLFIGGFGVGLSIALVLLAPAIEPGVLLCDRLRRRGASRAAVPPPPPHHPQAYRPLACGSAHARSLPRRARRNQPASWPENPRSAGCASRPAGQVRQ